MMNLPNVQTTGMYTGFATAGGYYGLGLAYQYAPAAIKVGVTAALSHSFGPTVGGYMATVAAPPIIGVAMPIIGPVAGAMGSVAGIGMCLAGRTVYQHAFDDTAKKAAHEEKNQMWLKDVNKAEKESGEIQAFSEAEENFFTHPELRDEDFAKVAKTSFKENVSILNKTRRSVGKTFLSFAATALKGLVWAK